MPDALSIPCGLLPGWVVVVDEPVVVDWAEAPAAVSPTRSAAIIHIFFIVFVVFVSMVVRTVAGFQG